MKLKDGKAASFHEAELADNYNSLNYDKNMAGYVLKTSHSLLEKKILNTDYYARVLEVGAGTGQHSFTVKHKYDEYWITDFSETILKFSKQKLQGNKKFHFDVQDATKLSYGDDSFDRVIATHVLEHLPEPQKVIREWCRVIRPGGILSLVLPCDPGMLWRLGRHLGPRENATKLGLPYDYLMAVEHINSISNLVNILKYYFKQIDVQWWPTRIPSVDLNLIYCANIYIDNRNIK